MKPGREELHFDGVGRKELLQSPSCLLECALSVARMADMRVLSSTVVPVGKHGHWHKTDNGWSVATVITTSHICMHSWPEHDAYMFDMVSCKPFCIEKVRIFVMEYFS